MRYIQKGESPEIFEIWKGKENDEWIPTWSKLQNPEKKVLKESLLNDQGYICCYCGVRIFNDHTTEIEHIKTRTSSGDDEKEKLDYNNLLASCIGGRREPGPPPERLSCNARRGDNELKLTPLQQDCEEKFLFTFDGRIIPSNEADLDCIAIINNLGLNVERLRNKRSALLSAYRVVDKETAKRLVISLSMKRHEDGITGYKQFNFVVINFLKKKFALELENIYIQA